MNPHLRKLVLRDYDELGKVGNRNHTLPLSMKILHTAFLQIRLVLFLVLGVLLSGHAAAQADELERLTALKEKGALTDEEFAAQKAKVLSA